MSNNSQCYSNGKEPPFLISFTTNRQCSNSRPQRDVNIVFGVYLRQRETFVASLPDVLDKDSLTNLLPAQEIAKRGIISANYAGLELGGITDTGEGKTRILTITYSTPADGETTSDIDDMSDADASWWTSEAGGKVYHERKKIKVTDTEKYSEYALQPKFGLTPNGADISPGDGEVRTTATASWGPTEEEDAEPDEEGDGWHLGGNHGGNHEPVPTGSIVSVVSTEAVQLSHLDIAKSLGLWNNVMAEHGTGALDELCAMLQSGAIVPGKDFRTGQPCYFYNSPDSSAKEILPEDAYGGVVPSFSQAMLYAQAVASNPTVIVPCTTMTITYRQRTVTMEDVTSAQVGNKLETTDEQGNKTPAPITEGGVNIPPPNYDFSNTKYSDIPTQTFWQYCGRSTDSMQIKTRYKMGKKYTFRDVTFTATYRSATTSALRYVKQPD